LDLQLVNLRPRLCIHILVFLVNFFIIVVFRGISLSQRCNIGHLPNRRRPHGHVRI